MLSWLLYPLIIIFILPFVIFILLYFSAFLLQLYSLRHYFIEVRQFDFWNHAKYIIAAIWVAHGQIWHAYEVVGLDSIPKTGPALIIYYHGALPVDYYYFMAHILLKYKRQIWAVGDNFLFKIPGFKLLTEVFCVIPGSVDSCVHLLKQGNLLSIAPGGVREALFSDERYKLIWAERCGFAKIALQANIPVIPMFTQNCREAFRSLQFGKSFMKYIYEKTRLPLVPIYGGFPVKLKTFIGKPIFPVENLSPIEFSNQIRLSIEQLIITHQQIPGSIISALKQRFYDPII